MAIDRFAYAAASSVEEALEVLDEQCRPLAGGMDLLHMMKEDLVAPSRIVSLRRIEGLDQVCQDQEALHVGALTPLFRLMDHPLVGGRQELAVLHEALAQTATPQIRHMATIGGNLLQRPRCWYFRNELTHCLRKGGQRCFAFRGENKYHAILGGGPCYIVHPSDPAVALLALDAAVVVAGQSGERTVPLVEFYLLPRQDPHREVALAPNELVTGIVIPAPAGGARGTYLKVPERGAHDFALASVALQLVVLDGKVQKARVALGGVAPVPWRASEAENVLQGSPLDGESIERAAQAATAGARPLAQNGHKVALAQALVRQALERLATPEGRARV